MNDTSYRIIFEGLDQGAQLKKLVVYFQKELGLSEGAIRNLLTQPPRVLSEASCLDHAALMQDGLRKMGCRTSVEPLALHPALPFPLARQHYNVINQELSKILRVRANLALFLIQIAPSSPGKPLPSLLGPILTRIAEGFRESDTVLGIDDSRLVILGFSTDREGVKRLEGKADRILKNVLGEGIVTTVGFALFPKDGRSLSALLHLAEQKRKKKETGGPSAEREAGPDHRVLKSPGQEKTGPFSLQQCFARARGKILQRLQGLDPEILWLGLSQLPEPKQREFWADLPFDSPLAPVVEEMIATQKPATSDTPVAIHFEAIINQLEKEEGGDGHREELKQAILSKLNRVEALPTLPAVASHIFSIASNANSSAQDLTKIIENDPPLTSKLLKIVNSAFYGFPQKIGNVKQAVVILGTDEIMDLSFGLAAANVFDVKPVEGVLDPKALWRHCMGTALIAQKLCQEMPKCHRLGGFTAGLLHDLGKIFILQHFPEPYRSLHLDLAQNGLQLFELEEQRLGLHHATVGEFLSTNWNLPEPLTRAIAFHHSPFSAPSHSEMAALVGLADYLHHRADAGEGAATAFRPPPLTMGHWAILKDHFTDLDEDKLVKMTQEAETLMSQNEHLFAMLN